MALTIGELVGFIRADGSDFERNLARSQLRMEGFRVDVNGRMRDLRGRFVRDANIMGRELATSFDEAEAAGTRITTVYSSVADAQSRTFRARMDRMREAGRRMASDLSGAFGRLRGAWDQVNFDRLKPIAQSFLGVAASVGKVGAAIGVAGPAASGLVATIGAIAPAAAVAVSGLIAMKLATTAFKIGMVGVGDAVKAAMDPSDPEAFAEALKKLSPSARAFALQVRELQPQLKRLQQDVQERMFKGLDGILREMGKTTLPVLRTGLLNASGALNRMAVGVGSAAIGLSARGTLGTAITGATTGLHNLSRVPGQVVQGLVQIGAAAAPSFARLTKAGGAAFDRLTLAMQKAFDDGRMQRAIENAISLVGDLFEVLGNLGSVFASVFKAAQVSGGGMLGVLKEITGQMAKAFASPEVQSGLKAVFGVMSELAKAVGPILVSLLKTVAQTFAVLGPPVRELVKHLGDGLLKIATALGPVVVSLAGAFGQLVVAALPIVDLAGDLIAGLLPILVPLFKTLGEVIRQAAPVVAALATAVGALLMPLLSTLATQVMPKLMPPFIQMANTVFPMLADVLVQLTPSLAELGVALADLLVELTPLIVKGLELSVVLLNKLMPVIAPLIALLVRLATGGLQFLTDAIRRYVIPAVQALAALVRGDLSGAMAHGKTLVGNFASDAGSKFTSLRDKGSSALLQLSQTVASKALAAGRGLIDGVRGPVAQVNGLFLNLPGQIRGALGGAGSMLYGIGRSILQGLIDGIRAKIGELRSVLGGITSSIPDWKGPAETDAKLLTPAGRSVIAGFQRGIAAQVPALRQQLQGLTTSLPGMGLGAVGAGGYGAAAATQQPIVIQLVGPGLRDVITDIVRVSGRGNVELAFGQPN
ncbi:hypothetical protein ACFQ67_00110 [Streptomyces sp. NPDC056488]|uniref:phage tail protein n=1 Tax=Streptomyces sp. NPDC056488 TaxID=3345836 RepID=UPI00367A4287